MHSGRRQRLEKYVVTVERRLMSVRSCRQKTASRELIDNLARGVLGIVLVE
jgi:hypothetical protein